MLANMKSILIPSNYKVVIDTNVIVSALIGHEGSACREILRLALKGTIKPMVGNTLFCEYEDVIGREYLFAGSPMDLQMRHDFLDDVLSVCEWADVHYLWRPNLKDEGDNHLVELAVSSGANYIVTQNMKDLTSGELNFENVRGIYPKTFLQLIRKQATEDENNGNDNTAAH